MDDLYRGRWKVVLICFVDLCTPLRSPKREESLKANTKWGKGPMGKKTDSLTFSSIQVSRGRLALKFFPLGQLNQRHWLYHLKLGCFLSIAFSLACLHFSSDNWSPSGLKRLTATWCPSPRALYSPLQFSAPGHTFLKSPFIKLSSNFPIWMCLLFWLILLLEKVKFKKDDCYSEGPDPQMRCCFGKEHCKTELVVLPGVVG